MNTAKLTPQNWTFFISLAISLALVSFSSAQEIGRMTVDQALTEALQKAGLNKQSARFNAGIMGLLRQGERSTALYDTLDFDPWRLPGITSALRREVVAAEGRSHELHNFGARLVGFGTRRTLIGSPIEPAIEVARKPGSLQEVLGRLRAERLVSTPSIELSQVPEPVQQAAALILETAHRTIPLRRAALSGLSDPERSFRVLGGGFPEEADQLVPYLQMADQVDLRLLSAAANDIFMAAGVAEEWLLAVDPSARYDVTIESSWGTIRLSGGSDTTYQERPYLLIIDTGGDDTYINACKNSSHTNWLSVLIDTNGNDQYLSSPALERTRIRDFPGRASEPTQPGNGAALLGIVALHDSRGDDLYRTHRRGTGSAMFGFALVRDRAGNDEYEAYRNSQGFGFFGGGILEDMEGNDRYHGFNQVQGCGLTQGFGLLVDRKGNDVYIAETSIIDFPSAQNRETNVSMAQGAGNGRRADFTDGLSQAGGVGILADLDGNDRYECGIFGQGTGYWMGIGFLWDYSGNDVYRGEWYVQGAAAHFAIGALEDLLGSDDYTANQSTSQGCGHDFSQGWLIDWHGNDRYRAPNLSLGAGSAGGIGIFVDVLGDDIYLARGNTLGFATESPEATLRTRELCLGLFIDMQGNDTFPPDVAWAKPGSFEVTFSRRGPSPAESQLGIFWDMR
jgi:hypothetical protein